MLNLYVCSMGWCLLESKMQPQQKALLCLAGARLQLPRGCGLRWEGGAGHRFCRAERHPELRPWLRLTRGRLWAAHCPAVALGPSAAACNHLSLGLCAMGRRSWGDLQGTAAFALLCVAGRPLFLLFVFSRILVLVRSRRAAFHCCFPSAPFSLLSRFSVPPRFPSRSARSALR